MANTDTHGQSSTLREFFEDDQRRPLLMRYSTTIILFAAILLLGLIFLPLKAPLTGLQKGITALVMLLSFVMVLGVITDQHKPIFAQILFAMLFVLQIAYIIAFYSGVDFSSLSHVFFNKDVMNGQWQIIWDGLKMTLHLSVYCIVFSTLLGLVIAILRQIKNMIITGILVGYLNFFRIMPGLVFLMFIYFGLPYAKIILPPFTCGVIAISISSGAFIGEVFRSGIEAIHKTQFEASRALGLTFFQSMRYVILPQAIKVVVPTLANQWVGIIKETAICSMISISDLLKAGQIIATWKANPTPLIISAAIYLVILLPLTIIVNRLEKNQKKVKGTAA